MTENAVILLNKSQAPLTELIRQGATARCLFPNGEWTFLPKEFGHIFKALEEFIPTFRTSFMNKFLGKRYQGSRL